MIPLACAGACLAVVVILLRIQTRKKDPVVCKLEGLTWTQKQLSFNSIAIGSIGTGKTVFMMNILDQLFINVAGWGGLFLDAKGDAHIDLMRLAKKHGRQDDVFILEVDKDKHAYPIQRLNLLSCGTPELVAEIFADLSMKESKSKNADFFRHQTIIHIAEGIRFLQNHGLSVTVPALYSFLCIPSFMVNQLKKLGGHVETDKDGNEHWVPDPSPEVDHWMHSYLNVKGEQFSGVTSSIQNALTPFLKDEVIEIFGSSLPNTVDFNDVNSGKILCVICPDSIPESKEALNQFFKSLFFATGAARYDRRKHGQKKENLLVTFLDEYQSAATPRDRKFLDKLRAADCAFIAAMQSYGSLTSEVGEVIAKNILGKFRNHAIFGTEDWSSAEHAASILGKKKKWQYSYGNSGGKGSSNRSQVYEYVLTPDYFYNRLPDHHCVIIRFDKKFRKNVKLPLV
jgi:hypothetical protein